MVDCKNDFRINVYNLRKRKKKIRCNAPPVFDEETGELIVNPKNQERALRRARVTLVDMALCNDFEFFGTITFSNEKHGEDIHNPYAMKDKVTKAFDNYKQRFAPDFQYIIVPEFGEKTHRLHFHFLAKGIPEKDLFINIHHHLDWRLTTEKFGHTQITRIGKTRKDKVNVAKYCSKYITKGNQKICNHRYFCSDGLKRPTKTISGDSCEALYISDWLEESGFPPYADSVYGKSYSVPYYLMQDLRFAIEERRKRLKNSKVRLIPLPDDFPTPFDDLVEVQERISCD